MKLKTLFVINAIVTAVFGIVFVVIPSQILSLYGADPNPQMNYTGQLFGAALIAIAIISWSARNATDSSARRAIVTGFFIGDVIGFIVAIIRQIGGVVNAIGWSTVVIYLLLALGFAIFTFKKPSS